MMRHRSVRPDVLSLRASRVVVGVDFGEPSLAAARWVARHLAPDAELVLVNVLPVPHAPDFLRDHLRSPDALVDQVAPPMLGGLQGFADTLGAKQLRVVLRVGDPAEQLADVAFTVAADLICVGRPRHRGGTARLGRNTMDRLLRRTTIPLLQPAGAMDAPPASMLAAVDGGWNSGSVLATAVARAAPCEARLTALHVLDEDVRAYVRAMEVAVGAAANADGAEESLRAAAAQWLVTSLETAGARRGRCDALVGLGDPGAEILAAAERVGADLILVGRSGQNAVSVGAVGSTTRLVLRAAACSVLVVPDAVVRVEPGGGPPPRRSRVTVPSVGARPVLQASDGAMPPAARWKTA